MSTHPIRVYIQREPWERILPWWPGCSWPRQEKRNEGMILLDHSLSLCLSLSLSLSSSSSSSSPLLSLSLPLLPSLPASLSTLSLGVSLSSFLHLSLFPLPSSLSSSLSLYTHDVQMDCTMYVWIVEKCAVDRQKTTHRTRRQRKEGRHAEQRQIGWSHTTIKGSEALHVHALCLWER